MPIPYDFIKKKNHLDNCEYLYLKKFSHKQAFGYLNFLSSFITTPKWLIIWNLSFSNSHSGEPHFNPRPADRNIYGFLESRWSHCI